MRRLLLLVVAAGLTALAVIVPRPAAPDGPEFTGASPVDLTGDPQGSVWYCPWMNAGAVRDAYLMIATEVDLEAQVTLPSPVPNEEPDQALVGIAGPGADPLEVASIVRRGDAPGFVEVDNGPTGVASVVTSETILTGDRCVSSVPKLWHLPGGTTRPDRTTLLRLFNPFPEPAKVTIAGTSEFGETGLAGLSSVDVPGRTWMDVQLNEIVALLDELSLTVSSEQGLVIPTLVVATELDEASWTGTGLSNTWEFPVVTQTGLVPSLVVSNPNDVAVDVEIDVYSAEGATTAIRSLTVPPGTPVRSDVSDLGNDFFAVAIRASEPVSAVVVAEDRPDLIAEEDTAEDETTTTEAEGEQEAVPQRIAGTVGNPVAATRWLLPGPGGIRTATSTLWVLNTGEQPATVDARPLGAETFDSTTIEVPAGSLQRLVLAQGGAVSGYLLESTAPVSAAWSIEAGQGVAFLAGVPIDG
jgi:hypothetical protein